MTIDQNFYNANSFLKLARDNFDANDLDQTLDSLAIVYSHVRALMTSVYELRKDRAVASKTPPGDPE